MALVHEDGTGLSTAESYGSVSEADAYFAARTGTAAATWAAATTGQKEGALRYATTHLDTEYCWHGVIRVADQALGWPRSGVVDHEGRAVAARPTQLLAACFELATEHLRVNLNAAHDRGGDIQREKVGELEVEYFAGAPAEAFRPFVERLLRGLTSGRRSSAADDSVALVTGWA